MEKTELTNEQRRNKRIARNRLARDIMLKLLEKEPIIHSNNLEKLAKNAVALATAFVNEIENNMI